MLPAPAPELVPSTVGRQQGWKAAAVVPPGPGFPLLGAVLTPCRRSAGAQLPAAPRGPWQPLQPPPPGPLQPCRGSAGRDAGHTETAGTAGTGQEVTEGPQRPAGPAQPPRQAHLPHDGVALLPARLEEDLQHLQHLVPRRVEAIRQPVLHRPGGKGQRWGRTQHCATQPASPAGDQAAAGAPGRPLPKPTAPT